MWQLGTVGATVALPVDVVQPCVPLIRCRVKGTTEGFGTLGVYSNLGGSGVSNRFAKVTASASIAGALGASVYVLGAPLLSPGPDAVVLRREAGSVEVDSIEFIPLADAHRYNGNTTITQRRARALNLSPVGGPSAGRPNASWDVMVDLSSGVPLTTGAAATTKVNTRWLFDLALGPNTSGVVLAQSVQNVPESGAWLIAQGYMFFRSGTSLIARKFDDAGAVDTTFAAAFPSATGIIRCALEVFYDDAADAFTVYLDGTSLGTVTAPAWHYYMAGLLAGTAAGGGYAAGTATVVQKASPVI
ncbi:hypothetical protein N866_13580 [Actinotalea ferrariae CF5-4]|uniref:Uncharacterized protein n=1 Tax=Actinotalea ferrariae CF5-4 TaxID=948458 RepID=A0A021VSZ6_9CELL|nr:hypothetical protein [Actinotalea ferrariae]EYR64276.1 hypothetical protein N866_13580 [Actinotalea ferrariae CF5-4]